MRIQKPSAILAGLAVAVIQLGLLTDVSNALTNSVCNYKMFPVFAGGNKDEFVYATEIDTSSKYILVGGMSQSANFAPAENNHGFLYALDMNGNWMWGNFFYNVSYAVSEIDGIRMSSKKNYVTVLG